MNEPKSTIRPDTSKPGAEATDRRGFRKWTDLGNAERLADRAHGRLLWVFGLGWLCWDGKRWRRDESNTVARIAGETVRSIYREAVVINRAAAAPADEDGLLLSRTAAIFLYGAPVAVNLNFDRAMLTLSGDLGPADRVLIVGVGRAKTKYQQALAGRTVIGIDIEPAEGVDLVADAHHLPFNDGEFDAVIAQAVLEHAYDPFQMVREIHRVLKPGGLVYTEIPFMQQVHEGARDYMRFTLSGHRVLMRDFTERDAGLVAGPGTVMLWSVEHLFLTVADGRLVKPVKALARVLFGWLSLLDYPLKRSRHSLDAASCTYFLGARSDTSRTVEEIATLY